MNNPFAIWAVFTTVAFVIGWSYLTYASLAANEFPLKPESSDSEVLRLLNQFHYKLNRLTNLMLGVLVP